MSSITYVCLFLSYRESLAPFSDEEIGRLCRAMLEYAATGEVPKLTGNERFIWPTLKGQIDRDAAEFQKRCEINRSNGQKGGRPKNRAVFEETEGFLEKPKKANKKEKESKRKNESENENDTLAPAEFERFWDAYPTNRGGREAALTEWEALDPDGNFGERLMFALDAFKGSAQWTEQEGKYIPSAAKWLAERRWEKPPVITQAAPQSGQRKLDADEQEAVRRLLEGDDWGIEDG